MLRRVLAFVRLGRLPFLAGGFILYGLGAALAARPAGATGAAAAIDWRRYAWGQLAITIVQLCTHYCNDYFDLAADRANATPTRWSGGSRVLSGDELPAWVALAAALVLAGAALLLAAAFARDPAMPRGAPALLGLMLLAAWEYSAPPLRLHSRGLGELDTALVVTLLTPLFGFYLQARHVAAEVVLAALPLCAFQFAMLLAIEFPDAAGDAAAGKRTLVVRLGGARAARLYQWVLVAAYAALPVLVACGLPGRLAAAFLLTAPVAAWQVARMRRGAWRDPARWESLAFVAVAMVGVGSGLMLVAALSGY
ncbi:MAG TPA: prenyltransferase [Polyangia bacterium]|nr:prenyltransferase [Polyangia bacterium]